MSVKAKKIRYQSQLDALSKAKKNPGAAGNLRPRDRIRIRQRCRLCGRPRAVYRKFGVCRICFRDMAAAGLVPGVKKSSW